MAWKRSSPLVFPVPAWHTCTRFATIDCDPDHFAFADADRTGEFRRTTGDDWAALDEIYRVDAADSDLAIDRSEVFWRHRVFEGWDKDPFVYVWEAGGEPRGYVIYTVESEDGDTTMQVKELASVDEDAYLCQRESPALPVRRECPTLCRN